MSTIAENVLSANGIVRSSDNNELRCFLCTIDETSRDWASHMENSRHVGALKQFRLIFIENGEKINCKACNSLIDWEGLKNHANWHRIVPWYEIEDKHKLFFENRILNVNESFVCIPCKVKFAEWSAAFVHIAEEEHQKSLSFEPPLHESFAPIVASYESLISEGFEPWGSTSVKCRPCNCPNVNLKNLSQHVESTDHAKAKKDFSSKYEIRRVERAESSVQKSADPIVVPRKTHDTRSRSMTRFGKNDQAHRQFVRYRRPSVESTFNGRNTGSKPRQDAMNFPVEKRGDCRYCTICEIVVRTTVDVHLQEEGHLNTLRRYGHEFIEPLDDHTYRCKSCSCIVPNLENVYRHIKGFNHRNRLKDRPKVETPKLEDPPKVETLKQGDPPKREDPPYSKTTSFKMNFPQPNASSVPQQTGIIHRFPSTLNRPNHIAANIRPSLEMNFAPMMKMALSQPMGLNFPAQYPPYLPQQMVTHQMGMPFPHSILPSPIPPLPKQSPANLTKSAWEALPRDYIVVQSSQDLFCRICDCAVYGHDNVDSHINGESHKLRVQEFCATISLLADNVYRCKKCSQDISGRDNLYMHMSGPKHAAGTKNQKISANDSPTKPRDSAVKESACSSATIDEMTNEQGNTSSATTPSDGCIVLLGKIDFCCKICHLVLRDLAKISDHLQGEDHAKAIKLYGGAAWRGDEYEGKYYCKFCSCTIPNFANVPLHTIGIKHKSSLPGSAKMFQPPRDKARSLANHFVGMIDEDVYYCRICNVSMYSELELDNHTTDRRHADVLEKYSAGCISVVRGNQYDCPYCECRVPDFENIFVHVSGKKHLQNVKDARRSGKKHGENIVEKAKVPETSDTPMMQDSREDSAIKLTDQDYRANEASSRSNSSDTRTPEVADTKENASNEPEARAPDNCGGKSSGPEAYERLIEMIVADTLAKDNQRVDKASSEENGKIESDVSPERVERQQSSSNDSSIQENRYRGERNIVSEDSASLKKSNEAIGTLEDDFSRIRSLASSTLSLNETGASGRKRRTPRAALSTNERKAFNIDHIYEMRDKLRELERAIKLCVIKDTNDVYCLICRRKIADTPENCAEHFWSLDHCEFFEGMEKDHALFEVVSGQFSELDLAKDYMEETSEDLIYCHVCNVDMDNIDFTLVDHMAEENHKEKCELMRQKADKRFHDMKPSVHCDWYKIYKYWCVLCSTNLDSELSFAKHLKSSGHSNVVKKLVNNHKGTMYDYCSSCALLWYGYRSTYASHVEVPAHKWQLADDAESSPKLPTSVKCLLTMPQEYIQDSINYLDDVFAKQYDKEATLIRDLEKTAKLFFPGARAHAFGSKVAGLESGENGIEVFLDCRDKNDGNDTSKKSTAEFKRKMNECLSQDQTLWHTEEILTKGPGIITALHRPTGISCDIYFENEIPVLTTKLLKSINDKFPLCRQIMIFVKQWLAFCDLFGPEKITIDALAWYVIFYLQRKSLLPKIATCVQPEKTPILIADWAIEENIFDFIQESYLGIRELLSGFFKFYANFDYRYDVACPLTGETVKKQAFSSPMTLPSEMKSYVDYLKNSNDPEGFRIEPPMCVQNPLSLADNLTKNVSKLQMNRFRTYCLKSLEILDGALA